MLIPLFFFAALALIAIRQLPDAYARFQVWQRKRRRVQHQRRIRREAKEAREAARWAATMKAGFLFGGIVADAVYASYLNSGHYAPTFRAEPAGPAMSDELSDMMGRAILCGHVIERYDLDTWKEILQMAVDNEDYETAAEARDNINRLQNETQT